jgi:hypothetical protein
MTTSMTLSDAINQGGGTVDEKGFALGNTKAVSVKRGEQVTVYNMRQIWSGKATDPKLQCGDRIFIPSRATGRGGLE